MSATSIEQPTTGTSCGLSRHDQRWLQNLDRLVAFFEAHGRFPALRESDSLSPHLGSWMQGMRQGRYVTDERIRLLDERAPGWRGNSDTQADEKFAAIFERLVDFREWRLEIYYNFRQTTPVYGHDGDGLSPDLGRWVSKARSGHGIAREQERVLDEKLPGWRGFLPEDFPTYVRLVAWFYSNHGRPQGPFEHIPLHEHAPDSIDTRRIHLRTGNWLQVMRRMVLTAEQEAALEQAAPGWRDWSADCSFEALVTRLAAAVKAQPGVPLTSLTDGQYVHVGHWAMRQRTVKLTAEQEAALENACPFWRGQSTERSVASTDAADSPQMGAGECAAGDTELKHDPSFEDMVGYLFGDTDSSDQSHIDRFMSMMQSRRRGQGRPGVEPDMNAQADATE